MSRLKLSDFNFNSNETRRYEVELNGIKIKADSAEDHSRALETIQALQKLTVHSHSAPSVVDEVSSGLPNGLTLTELLNQYLLMKKLASSSVPAIKKVVEEFGKFSKNKQVHQVLKSDATRFAEHLKKSGLALQTVQTKFNLLKAIFNFAREYSYLKTDNPFTLKIMSKSEKLRASFDIFDDEDIVSIFEKSYFSPQKNKDPDYFWVCFIAVLTGIRVGALTNLKKSDVKKTDSNIWFFRIRDDKTENGKRDVPIISEVFEEGFEAFVNSKTDALFNYFEIEGRGKGNAVGKKFNRRLIELNLKNRKLVFHSLRKYANNFYAKAGVGLEARCQFFGHDIENTNSQYYTKPYNNEQLFELIAPAQRRILAKIGQDKPH